MRRKQKTIRKESERNEKVNLSETWNLIPVSSGKLWLNNIFSSLLTCAYIFIVQNVLLALVALSTKNDITAPLREYGLALIQI